MISTKELRNKFISYFESKNHSHQPSSSLIPFGDDTLLFTNAGMVQFKDVFLGLEKRDFSRAVTVQKCLRAGGKHNDLDNVGYTARHHTFFEMLGNFSFGDYFKKDAISFAWEFLIKEIKLPVEKLWVTIYATDDEAFDVWHNHIGLPKERIIRIDSNDNFWSMGDTGPCGPCTEIFYDHGEDVAGGLPGTPDEDGDRYIEIWNIVFMQFNRHADGTVTDLPKPSVDTGMGLERIAAVLQDVHSNYDIDLFQALIKKAQEVTNADDINSPSLKVVADHIRSCAFLIADGVLPSNEGRGYVLRRIIRRAIRHGNKLGAKDIFFYKLVAELINQMGEAYPQLIDKRELIEKTLIKEEELFLKTIENGIKIFDTEIASLKSDTISGEIAFRLYDTYGFPLDLTADMAREKGLKVDEEAFKEQMLKQKQRSKEAGKFNVDYNSIINSQAKSDFRGYSTLIEDAKVLELYQDGQPVNIIQAESTAVIVLDRTPFYAESGGQVGDKGVLEGVGVEFIVEDVQKSGEAILHIGKLSKGILNTYDEVTASVNDSVRLATAANHSATHLLHKALKIVLGSHAEQKGSLVDDNKLRFDFTHDKAISRVEIEQIETLVNQQIRANYPVATIETSQEKAKSLGAEALFGEKYGDIVRVISMGDFSIELCGGTHVAYTGDIGLFKIVSENGIASGIRRIEAITADKAIKHTFAIENKLAAIKEITKSNDSNLLDKLQSMLEQLKNQEKEIAKLKKDILSGANSDIKESSIDGIKLIIANLEGVDIKTLREKIDDYKSKNDKMVAVLSTINADKVQFVIGVSKSITSLIKAGDIAKEFSCYIDGKGGGRPDMAQGGGNNSTNIDKALSDLEKYISINIKK
ncbi:alanine--tRNA ligase [Francisella philomiragia]|uniref:Alanine--tRNA ligase n=1 Tax=Francisella philomiragia TaxID=28110 RepID=A0AAW3DCL7_9GAMM|nr:alanine--tRNA ligase [Francisella philomiragia]KFJ43854.1 alanine--tRNA ligase [Francisella philomiragia]MBK2254337.1 alanine--tRNA ligase [Francisella philomiragia]MBK2272870.1 alanine--tRNA ligase [Francisella philomiragia]MBK2276491.1 alanine--tRNA ligase [Francisella philomiragia]MBK2281723.1 alanine--tRNA ligase [Francisella philomiragia]